MLILVMKKRFNKLFPYISEIGPVHSVKISPDSKFIVSSSEDRSIKIFDIESRQQLYYFKDVHEGIFFAII